MKIKGSALMLFVDGKSISYATNHTLEINAETTSTQNKDESSGEWASDEVNTLSWNASSENLYSTDGEGNNFDQIFDLMVAKTPIDAVFCKKSETATDVPTGGWTPSVPKYVGKVIVTSLSLNAPVGEYSSYSAQFQGVGELKKVTA